MADTHRRLVGAIAVTLMWAAIIPVMFLLFTKGVGMPLRLTSFLLAPILVIWVPASYPIAIAGDERYRRGEGLDLPPKALAATGGLGLVTGLLGTCALFLDVMLQSAAYAGAGIFSLMACACLWAAKKLVVQLVDEMRRG